jgi:hypothetical protein
VKRVTLTVKRVTSKSTLHNTYFLFNLGISGPPNIKMLTNNYLFNSLSYLWKIFTVSWVWNIGMLCSSVRMERVIWLRQTAWSMLHAPIFHRISWGFFLLASDYRLFLLTNMWKIRIWQPFWPSNILLWNENLCKKL